MEFFEDFSTLQPLQLPWMHVSPANARGLDYHLTPNLFLRMEGIVSGEEEFSISEIIMSIETGRINSKEPVEVNILEDEDIFIREHLVNKTQARIDRSFKEPDISAFFKQRHMDVLEQVFENSNYFVQSITVYYRGQKLDDIRQLGEKDYKILLKTFDDLRVRGGVDFRKSNEELKEQYDEGLRENIAAKEDKAKTKLWERITKKESRKHTITAVTTTAIGVGAWVAKRALMSFGGIWGKLAAVVVGTVGICLETYGRHEIGEIVRGIKNKAEGGF